MAFTIVTEEVTVNHVASNNVIGYFQCRERLPATVTMPAFLHHKLPLIHFVFCLLLLKKVSAHREKAVDTVIVLW